MAGKSAYNFSPPIILSLDAKIRIFDHRSLSREALSGCYNLVHMWYSTEPGRERSLEAEREGLSTAGWMAIRASALMYFGSKNFFFLEQRMATSCSLWLRCLSSPHNCNLLCRSKWDSVGSFCSVEKWLP